MAGLPPLTYPGTAEGGEEAQAKGGTEAPKRLTTSRTRSRGCDILSKTEGDSTSAQIFPRRVTTWVPKKR